MEQLENRWRLDFPRRTCHKRSNKLSLTCYEMWHQLAQTLCLEDRHEERITHINDNPRASPAEEDDLSSRNSFGAMTLATAESQSVRIATDRKHPRARQRRRVTRYHPQPAFALNLSSLIDTCKSYTEGDHCGGFFRS